MDQFDKNNTALNCAMCQAMCPEAVDGTLTATEQAAFDKHVAGCVECAQELTDAHRGAAWMEMLKGHTPEPPSMLLQRIIAQTSEAPLYMPVAQPEPQSWWAGFSAKLSTTFSLQSMSMSPRIAMTAAMAFFSLALTMNMLGVHVTDIRMSSLRPSAIRHSISDVSSGGIRSFQNLRVVYEFESRMNDMRNDGALGDRFQDKRQDSGTPFTGSQQKDDKKQQDQLPQGKSALEIPKMRNAIVESGA